MQHQITPISVPFHGSNLFVVKHDGQPYVPMKHTVEGMGLDWKTQHRKLTTNTDRWGMVMMTIPSVSGIQDTACIPLRKLSGWLMAIQPSKVRPEIREKIVTYQNECDGVLWDYWTKGGAVNPRATQEDQPHPDLLQTQVKELGFLLAHSQPDFQWMPELADQLDIMKRRESAFRQILLEQSSVQQEKPAASAQPAEYAGDSPVGLDGLPVATLVGNIPVVVVKGRKYVGVAAICRETGINIKKQQETKAYKEQKLYAMVPTAEGLRRRAMLPASVFELKASQHRLPDENRESLDKTLFFVAESYSMLTH